MATERVSCKKEDYLDSDPPIRGQNYVCLSFISPEDVILKKDIYFLHKFMNLFTADVSDLFDKLSDKFKDDAGVVDMFKNLRDRYDYLFEADKLQEEFSFYKAKNSEKLESEYLEKNNFQTSIRGIKIRGCFETLPEAQRRAEILKKQDGKFDVYVAEVGCWCPWAPNPVEIQDQEYAETELNTLMKKYKDNLDEKELFYKQRTEELRKKANEQRNSLQQQVIQEEGESSTTGSDEDQQPTTQDLVSSSDPWMDRKDSTTEDGASSSA